MISSGRAISGTVRESALLVLLELGIVVHEDPVAVARIFSIDASPCSTDVSPPGGVGRAEVLHETRGITGDADDPLIGLDQDRLMAGRMPGRLDRLDAGDDLVEVLVDQARSS